MEPQQVTWGLPFPREGTISEQPARRSLGLNGHFHQLREAQKENKNFLSGLPGLLPHLHLARRSTKGRLLRATPSRGLRSPEAGDDGGRDDTLAGISRSRAIASLLCIRVLNHMTAPKQGAGRGWGWSPKMSGNGGEAFPIGIRLLN